MNKDLLREALANKIHIALNESEENGALEEMSRRRAAAVGAAVGGALGSLAGPVGTAVGAAQGAALGATWAKGKQRTLDDQIRSAEKKIQAWSKDPSNKEKIAKKREQIAKWKKELIELKKSGKGESGINRTKMADVDYGRESAKRMKK